MRGGGCECVCVCLPVCVCVRGEREGGRGGGRERDVWLVSNDLVEMLSFFCPTSDSLLDP